MRTLCIALLAGYNIHMRGLCAFRSSHQVEAYAQALENTQIAQESDYDTIKLAVRRIGGRMRSNSLRRRVGKFKTQGNHPGTRSTYHATYTHKDVQIADLVPLLVAAVREHRHLAPSESDIALVVVPGRERRMAQETILTDALS